MSKPRTSAADRMWRRTVARPSGCVEFTGSTDKQGYGQVHDRDRGRPIKAHRLAWESRVGPIPEGLCVLHRCDNPRCVSVEHLFLGTIADNNRDMCAKGRQHNQVRSHCKHGHELAGDNLLISTGKSGTYRRCRECARNNLRRFRAKRSAA